MQLRLENAIAPLFLAWNAPFYSLRTSINVFIPEIDYFYKLPAEGLLNYFVVSWDTRAVTDTDPAILSSNLNVFSFFSSVTRYLTLSLILDICNRISLSGISNTNNGTKILSVFRVSNCLDNFYSNIWWQLENVLKHRLVESILFLCRADNGISVSCKLVYKNWLMEI